MPWHRPSAEGTVKGGAAGAAVGTELGAATGVLADALFAGMFAVDPDIGEAAATGAAYGPVDGTLTGAAVGAMASSPIWQELTVLELRQEPCPCRLTAETTASRFIALRWVDGRTGEAQSTPSQRSVTSSFARSVLDVLLAIPTESPCFGQ